MTAVGRALLAEYRFEGVVGGVAGADGGFPVGCLGYPPMGQAWRDDHDNLCLPWSSRGSPWEVKVGSEGFAIGEKK